MNAMQALQKFWGGFGLAAYDENTVPDGAALPYLTYEASQDYFGNDLSQAASVWYRSTSWAEATEKADEISKRIGAGGIMIQCDGGGLWIKRGTPWAQRMSDSSDDMIRRIYLNYEIEFITA